FLDLKRNKYTAIDPDALQSLRAVVRGWPQSSAQSATAPASDDSNDDASILRLLLRDGVLTEDDRLGKDPVPVIVEHVIETIDNVRGAYPSITWRDLRNFVRAWAFVSAALRTLPLIRVVNRVRKRKSSLQGGQYVFDPRKAHRLMTAYWIL